MIIDMDVYKGLNAYGKGLMPCVDATAVTNGVFVLRSVYNTGVTHYTTPVVLGVYDGTGSSYYS